MTASQPGNAPNSASPRADAPTAERHPDVRAQIAEGAALDAPYAVMNVLTTVVACYGLLETAPQWSSGPCSSPCFWGRLRALLLLECEELGGVDWQWQAADGCLGKARGVPRVQDRAQNPVAQKGALVTPQSVSAGTRLTVPKQASRRACLSREMAARLRCASQGPTLLT